MEPLVDLTALGADFARDPYPVYARLRERGPVHHVLSDDGEVWLVVGYDAVREALADPRLHKDWRLRMSPQEAAGLPDISANMLESDVPRHTRLRRLVTREFTARRIAALAPRIRRITDDLLDAMLAAPGRRANLVEALAFPLPITVICELLGVPDLERDDFRAWSHEVVSPTTPEAEEAATAAMGRYLDELIEDKRVQPRGDDLLGALIRTREEDGDALSRQELIGMAFLLLVAGHETTVNLLANGMLALLSHPDQLAALRAGPDTLLDGAVEEMLRYDGPVETSTFRFTTEPVEIHGVPVPAGAVVRVVISSAERDPARFDAPDTFDIRRDTQGHLAFGHGIHYCLGAPLARLEGRIAVRALLDRCPDLALDGEARDWRQGLLIRGPGVLPVRW
ncbi:Cytochrome P450 monooxygenase PikC [Streptomyces sp. RB5]|uniref:Cytochrome P450 monooxygenase PikC n=1 Tax=Streptomyces smaragdinus TaxID=2585196 RepID=A0A7K0CME0_9ACTN|nr:cytochrome P450 [Streptomyces smaragdinus]MQY14571.1 Cytochrome P450 monooxygenase PikC [Streptomyces smaragdinus]